MSLRFDFFRSGLSVAGGVSVMGVVVVAIVSWHIVVTIGVSIDPGFCEANCCRG